MSAWKGKLDVSDIFRADMPFEMRRDEMVRRVRRLDPNDALLDDIADGLGDSIDTDEWDCWWDEFYDWADHNRVWVITR